MITTFIPAVALTRGLSLIDHGTVVGRVRSAHVDRTGVQVRLVDTNGQERRRRLSARAYVEVAAR